VRLLLLLLLACQPYVRRPLSVQDQNKASVLIDVTCRDENGLEGKRYLGSGVLVDSWHAVTASHVVACLGEKQGSISVSQGFHDTTALLVTFDHLHDLAVLELQEPFAVQPPTLRNPKEDSMVCFQPAFPEGPRQCGIILGVKDWSELLGFEVDLRLNLHIIPGNSGAGLFDLQGNLIGLITHGNSHTLGFGTSLLRLGQVPPRI
jgi:S1-C subfamily serine protease